MASNVQPPPDVQPTPSTTAYSKPSSTSSASSSSSQSSSRPGVPHITFGDAQLSPTFTTEDGSIYKHTKKQRTYSDARRRGSSRLTLDEVPELDILEPEPMWEEDEDSTEKLPDGEQRSDTSGASSFLAATGGYEGDEIRRTITAPSFSRPMSSRRERLSPSNSTSWPRVKRMGLGMRSKSYGATSPGITN